MRTVIQLSLVLLFTQALVLPVRAMATSYSPLEERREVKAAEGIREKGEVVCLFHSGTESVKKAIKRGDVLIVYREGPKHERKEVGTVQVLSYRGQDYIQGAVLAGELKTGDIAVKDDVASLVISSAEKCE